MIAGFIGRIESEPTVGVGPESESVSVRSLSNRDDNRVWFPDSATDVIVELRLSRNGGVEVDFEAERRPVKKEAERGNRSGYTGKGKESE